MKMLMLLFVLLFITGCGNPKHDRNPDDSYFMLLGKFKVLCTDHYGYFNHYESGKYKYLICKDGFTIKNYNIEDIYGQEVYDEFNRLKNEYNERNKNVK